MRAQRAYRVWVSDIQEVTTPPIAQCGSLGVAILQAIKRLHPPVKYSPAFNGAEVICYRKIGRTGQGHKKGEEVQTLAATPPVKNNAF